MLLLSSTYKDSSRVDLTGIESKFIRQFQSHGSTVKLISVVNFSGHTCPFFKFRISDSKLGVRELRIENETSGKAGIN